MKKNTIAYIVLTAKNAAEIERFKQAHGQREAVYGELYQNGQKLPMLILPEKVYPVADEVNEFFSVFDLTPWGEMQSEIPKNELRAGSFKVMKRAVLTISDSRSFEGAKQALLEFSRKENTGILVYPTNRGRLQAEFFYPVSNELDSYEETEWLCRLCHLTSKLYGRVDFGKVACRFKFV